MPNAKPETRYYTRINRRLPPTTILHRQKIGSATTNGTADCWYSGNRADLWVEYKWADRKEGDIDVRKLLTALQRNWLNSRLREKRNVAVIVGTPQGSQILVGGAWENVYPVKAFNLTDAQVARYLTEFCLHDIPEVTCEGRGSDKSDLQDSDHVATHSGHRV